MGFKTVWHIPVDVFRSNVETSKTLREITTKCGFKNINNYDALLERITRDNIDMSHVKYKSHSKVKRSKRQAWRAEIDDRCDNQLSSCTTIYEPDGLMNDMLANMKSKMQTQVPILVQQMTSNPLSIQLTDDKNDESFKGVVYMVHCKTMNTIIYIGSSRRFDKRKVSHKSHYMKSEASSEFHKYVKDNNLLNDIQFIPIITCPGGYGFEVHLESEFIKACACNFPLQNEGVPLVSGMTLDTHGVIYGLFNTNGDCGGPPKYVGKSIKYYDRVVKHMTDAYNEKSEKKLFQKIREIDSEQWPSCLEFRIIEKCPIWMLDNRENHYIKLYDMKNTGWNSFSNMSTQEDIDEEKERHKQYQSANSHIVYPSAQPVECPICHSTLSSKQKLDYHVKICKGVHHVQLSRNKPGQGSISKHGDGYQVRTPMINGKFGNLIGSFKTREGAEECLKDYQRKIANNEEITLQNPRRKRGTGNIRKKRNKFEALSPMINGKATYIGSFKTHDEAETALTQWLNK